MAGIFHAYDVRGIYPTAINERAAYKLGIAIGRHFKTDAICVGYDARTHSPSLKEAFCLGLNKEGVHVLDFGMSSTPMSYFAAQSYPSVIVTASHNPKEYNGFKINARGPIAIGLGNGLERIEALYNTLADVDLPLHKPPVNSTPYPILDEFCAHMAGKVKIHRKMRVVADASNGVTGTSLKKLAELLGFDLHLINDEPDGNFPAHGPNPIAAGAADDAIAAVHATHADFGIIFDNDGDRTVLIDEKGNTLSPEQAGTLIATHLLAKHNNKGSVVYDCTTSLLAKEVIEQQGGDAVECAVGRTIILQSMIQHEALFGMEVSGHYYFKDYWYEDSGELMLLFFLEALSSSKETLSERIAHYPVYHKWNDNFPISDKPAFLHAFEQKFSSHAISKIDGVKVIGSDFWIVARPSNTEPVMRFAAEASSEEQLASLKKQIVALAEQF